MFRKGIVLLLALACVAFAACGSDDKGGSSTSSGGSSGGDEVTVGVVMKDTTNPYFRSIVRGIEEAADRAGNVEVVEQSPTREADVQGQVDRVQQQITAKVDALIVAPDGPQLQPILQQAVDAGIPVVLADASIPGWDDYTALVGTDNVAAGRDGMRALLAAIGGDPVVGLIGLPGSPPVADRIEGATQELAANGLKPVQTVDGRADQQTTQNAVEDLLRAHPDVNGLFACCSASSLGAVQALRTSGKTDVAVVGVDGIPAEFEAIEAGTLTGTVGQRPVGMGTLSLETALKAIGGESVEKKVIAPHDVVTKDNVAEFIGRQR